MGQMINPLDGRNTKKLKKQKTKTADFLVNTRILVKVDLIPLHQLKPKT